MVFWFKVLTLGVISYVNSVYKEKELYYYQNLGVSKSVLLASTMLLDFVLFIASIVTIHTFHAA